MTGKFSDIEKSWREKLEAEVEVNFPADLRPAPKQIPQEKKIELTSEKPIIEAELREKSKLNINKTQVILIILTIVLTLGLIQFNNFVKDGYFNSTIIDNSTCTIPEIPKCPDATTCPACPNPNIYVNFTLPNTLNLTGVNVTI